MLDFTHDPDDPTIARRARDIETMKRVMGRLGRGWCQDANGRAAQGYKVGAKDPNAVAWCMGGAILAEADDLAVAYRLRHCLGLHVGVQVEQFNDHPKTTKKHVLDACAAFTAEVAQGQYDKVELPALCPPVFTCSNNGKALGKTVMASGAKPTFVVVYDSHFEKFLNIAVSAQNFNTELAKYADPQKLIQHWVLLPGTTVGPEVKPGQTKAVAKQLAFA